MLLTPAALHAAFLPAYQPPWIVSESSSSKSKKLKPARSKQSFSSISHTHKKKHITICLRSDAGQPRAAVFTSLGCTFCFATGEKTTNRTQWIRTRVDTRTKQRKSGGVIAHSIYNKVTTFTLHISHKFHQHFSQIISLVEGGEGVRTNERRQGGWHDMTHCWNRCSIKKGITSFWRG